jgi:hypothetical protein
MSGNTSVTAGLILLLGIFTCVTLAQKKKISTREPYSDLFFANNFSKNNWVSRPSFKADLSPRFDNTSVRSGGITGTPPPLAMQGSPPTPVMPLVEPYQGASETFASLGATYDTRLPQGGLTTSQVNEILAQKFGRNGPENYVEPSSLLPEPDMRKAVAKDPSNPSTFVYDRYLFSNLKRRYGNVGVDFIRGDIPITPIRTGWFDVPLPVKTDLQRGYVSDYLDIVQSSNLLDTVYERKPTSLQQLDPWGNLAGRTMYSLV